VYDESDTKSPTEKKDMPPNRKVVVACSKSKDARRTVHLYRRYGNQQQKDYPDNQVSFEVFLYKVFHNSDEFENILIL